MAKAKKKSAPKRKTQVISTESVTKAELMERKNYHKGQAWNRCPCEAPDSVVHWVQLERMLNEAPHLFSSTEARIISERIRAWRENLND